MDVIDAAEFERQLDDPVPGDRDSEYVEFQEDEGIPIHTGFFIEDVRELETGHWHRTGQQGAFVNLYGMQYVDDLQIHELEPGGETDTVRHFYDEIVYAVEGNGLTKVGDRSFEWQEQSVFYLPTNVPYKFVNLRDEPARLVCNTHLPQLFPMLSDEHAIFDNPYDPWEHEDTEGYYAAEGSASSFYEQKYGDDAGPAAWETNFIPDLLAFDRMEGWGRVGSMDIVMIPLPQSHQYAHVSELSVGQYKNAHRHTPGANIFALTGEGYDLLWEPGGPKVKVDWEPFSVFTPPACWYHQHFNTNDEPSKQFVMHQPRFGSLGDHGFVFDGHHDNNLIRYHEEDPGIRELYGRELAENGLESRMPEECYTDPDYTFA